MEKLDMFQEVFGKLYQFGWWDMEIIQTDAGTRFTSKEFQEVLSIRGVQLTLASSDHQEMNGKVEVTSQALRTITQSIMVHALVYNEYIHFELMYPTDRVFTVLPIKNW